MLFFSFLSTYILILSNYEYEVTLKKGYILTGNISERNRWI